jgi:3-isopropylmalate dehydrogenase
MQYKIGIMNGDDIGLEVVPAAIEVMKKAVSLFPTIEIEWTDLPIGYPAYVQLGQTLPDNTLATLERLDGWILGPIGHAAYPKDDPMAVNPHPIIRKHFDLHSNIRPCLSYDNVPSVQREVDLIIVRENNEGFQPDRNVHVGSGEFMPTADLAMSVRVITRRNCEAVSETAFLLAQHRKKKVTAIHKATVFKLGCGLFLESCRKIASKYPEVQYEEIQVDAMAAALVMRPQSFDVVVTTNMFGDILSDLAAGLVGGLGMAPGVCVGPKYTMAQATHGSAPDIAGKQIANPYAMIMSGQMLLEWFALKHRDDDLLKASQCIQEAVAKTIQEGAVTRDLGGTLSTGEMASAICRKM